jgi:hypothetical protein
MRKRQVEGNLHEYLQSNTEYRARKLSKRKENMAQWQVSWLALETKRIMAEFRRQDQRLSAQTIFSLLTHRFPDEKSLNEVSFSMFQRFLKTAGFKYSKGATKQECYWSHEDVEYLVH